MRWPVLLLFVFLLNPAPSVEGQQARLDRSLFDASWRGNAKEVAGLLEQGANPNSAIRRSTPLHKAASRGHLDVMRLLIDRGADVKAKDGGGRSTLAEAAGALKPQAAKMLLDAGAEPDDFALGQAGWLGQLETVKVLLDAGANPDAGLVRAAQGGHVEILKILLDKGANIKTTAESKEGDTALHTGALQGGFEAVRLLLERGADPNAANDAGKTPLHLAIAGDGELKTIKLLVQAGTKLNVADKEGITPVRLAAIAGSRRKQAYEWLVTAAGGKEPTPQRGEAPRPGAKSTKELMAALSSKKPDDRLAAQRELVTRGKEVVPEVLQSIESGDDIERYFGLLAALGPEAESALPKLESLLGEKDRVFGAAVALDRIKPGSLDALPQQSKAKAAAAVASALGDRELDMIGSYYLSLLNRFGDASVPHMLKLLRSEYVETRRRAASSLRSVGFDSDELAAELIKLAKDDSSSAVRSAAISTLGRFGPPSQELRTVLLSIIKYPPPRGPNETEGKGLTPFQEWSETSSSAARSLARFGPTVIDDLLPLLSPISAPQRGPAITTLVSIGAPAVPRLIKLLGHEDSSVAISASVALNEIGSSAVPALAEAVSTGNEQVIDHASSALWWIGPGAKAALPTLLEVAGSGENSDASRIAALRAALKISGPECRKSKAIPAVIPALIRTLENGNFKQQGWAAEAAGGIGPAARDALPALRKRLELPAPDTDTSGLVRAYVQREAKEAIATIEAGGTGETP